MKTVEITIRVEVPDSATNVAVDETGVPVCDDRPMTQSESEGLDYPGGFGSWSGYTAGRDWMLRVVNWRETLTEVK